MVRESLAKYYRNLKDKTLFVENKKIGVNTLY